MCTEFESVPISEGLHLTYRTATCNHILVACILSLSASGAGFMRTLSGCKAGIFFGRTPLIKLSPKKTWEGFFGGLLITVLAAWMLAEYMSRFKWMVCERTVRPCKRRQLCTLPLSAAAVPCRGAVCRPAHATV